jgi:cytochrome b
MLMNLAGYLAAVDELSEACAAAREAISMLAAHEPAGAIVAITVEHLALAIALGGDLSRAATLAGYADAALQRHGYEREFTERATHDRLTTLLRDNPEHDGLARLLADGAALTSEAAVALACEEP